MKQFDAVDVIRVKRDGGKLSTEEIQWTIDAYTRGVMKDEQMAALAMAVFLRGMDREEIVTWTQAMIDSGERMDLRVFLALPRISTRPVAWAIRSPFRLPRLLQSSALQCRSFPVEASATRVEPSTSSKLSPAGVHLCPMTRSTTNWVKAAEP